MMPPIPYMLEEFSEHSRPSHSWLHGARYQRPIQISLEYHDKMFPLPLSQNSLACFLLECSSRFVNNQSVGTSS